MNNWEDKNEVIIGNYGEDLITSILEKQNYVVYRTSTNKSHPIDLICIDTDNEDEIMYVEIKTKSRRYCCSDTGIDLHSWNRYINLINQDNKKAYLFFVDEFEKCIYYCCINKIYKEKKFRIKYDEGAKNGIVYFNLEDLKLSKRLKQTEIEHFKDLRNQLNHPIKDLIRYRNTTKYFE